MSSPSPILNSLTFDEKKSLAGLIAVSTRSVNSHILQLQLVKTKVVYYAVSAAQQMERAGAVVKGVGLDQRKKLVVLAFPE